MQRNTTKGIGSQHQIQEVNKKDAQFFAALASMNDNERMVLVELAKGKSALEACLNGKARSFLQTIRSLYTRKGKKINSSDLTIDDALDLSPPSFARATAAAERYVTTLKSVNQVAHYMPDIQSMFRMLAPNALSVLAKQLESDNEKISQSASVAILNRAGYAEAPSNREAPSMPVQVNILFDQKAKAEERNIIEYAPPEELINGEVGDGPEDTDRN